MLRIALKMLVGDRAKYLALVCGLGFSVLLITQQMSIFLGLLLRATGFLQNIAQPDLWIANPNTRYVLEVRPLDDADLSRVRSVPGVAWAAPFFAARATVDRPDGKFNTAELLGIDRSTLIGQPPEILEGRLEDLRLPDAVMIEASGVEKLNGVKIGDRLKLNDRRAVVVGIFRAKLGFESNIMLYTTYENAIEFVPTGRDKMSFVMVGVKEGYAVDDVKRAIEGRFDHLAALTRNEFRLRTIDFILKETGIGINFGITVLLGLLVGLIVSAATLYQFTLDNLRHYGVLKAMGATSRTLIGMILVQAIFAGLMAFGLGVGAAGIFVAASQRPGSELVAYFPWPLMLGSLAAMLACVSIGSLLSLRRVLSLEPAVVFR
jgi:putative ABC transport system permease protein